MLVKCGRNHQMWWSQGCWLWGCGNWQHQGGAAAAQWLVLGSVVLNAFMRDPGTELSMLVGFAEDAEVKGTISKAWHVLQEGLCDLDYGDRKEVQWYRGKSPSHGVNGRNSRYWLGVGFPMAYRLLVYSRCTQAFLLWWLSSWLWSRFCDYKRVNACCVFNNFFHDQQLIVSCLIHELFWLCARTKT